MVEEEKEAVIMAAAKWTVTNKWVSPNGLTVWSYSIPFPDGMRSAVALVRSGYTPTQKSGWTAISTVSPSSSTISGASGAIGTAAKFDERMAKGDVLFDLRAKTSAGLGRAPWSGKQVSQGLWSRSAAIATGSGAANEDAAFTWGLQKLASKGAAAITATVANGAPSSGSVVSSSPTGATTGSNGIVKKTTALPVKKIAAPPPPPPPKPRWPYYAGGLVLTGLAVMLLVD